MAALPAQENALFAEVRQFADAEFDLQALCLEKAGIVGQQKGGIRALELPVEQESYGLHGHLKRLFISILPAAMSWLVPSRIAER